MASAASSGDAPASPDDAAAEAFAAFFRANYGPVLALVRYRTSGDCEAIVADSFLVAWQHYRLTSELNRAWLFGVARNKIGDSYRSAKRREVPVADLALVPDEADPAAQWEARAEVRRVLRALPARHSEPLILAYWCDLDSGEAAAALGVHPGTFRVRLHRAHRAFLSEFDRQNRRFSGMEEVGTWTVPSS